jgi:hypothetical protein
VSLDVRTEVVIARPRTSPTFRDLAALKALLES